MGPFTATHDAGRAEGRAIAPLYTASKAAVTMRGPTRSSNSPPSERTDRPEPSVTVTVRWPGGASLTFTSRSDMMSLSNYLAQLSGRTAHARAREHPAVHARRGRTRRALQVDRAVEHDARHPDGDDQPVDPADLAAGAVPRHQAQPPGAVQHLLLPLGVPRLPPGHRRAGGEPRPGRRHLRPGP